MKISKIVLTLFSCLVVFAVLYQIKYGKQLKDDNVLVVGTSLDYPPYALKDIQTGQAIGFDIDVVSEIAHRLHKKLILQDMPFSSLIFGLLTDEVDLIAAGMSPTERRSKLVSFSKIYLEEPLIILTQADHFKPESLQDLKGKLVAVNTGYFADAFMSAYPDISLVRLDSPSDCFMALQTGTVDAFVCVQGTVKNFLNIISNPEQFAQVKIISDDALERCALVVSKNNEKLLQQVNKIIDAMIADGTMQIMKQKWGF